MVVDDPFCIAHAAVANLDGVAVEYFSKLTTTRGGDSLPLPIPLTAYSAYVWCFPRISSWN